MNTKFAYLCTELLSFSNYHSESYWPGKNFGLGSTDPTAVANYLLSCWVGNTYGERCDRGIKNYSWGRMAQLVGRVLSYYHLESGPGASRSLSWSNREMTLAFAQLLLEFLRDFNSTNQSLKDFL